MRKGKERVASVVPNNTATTRVTIKFAGTIGVKLEGRPWGVAPLYDFELDGSSGLAVNTKLFQNIPVCVDWLL